MPALVQTYDVLLDLINDMQDSVSIQLLRDYGRNAGTVVLLNPMESVTLVLESGSPYRYAIKSRTRVANITAKSWRDIQCYVSHLFSGANSNPPGDDSPITSSANRDTQQQPVNGVSVDRLWRDHRFCVWPEVIATTDLQTDFTNCNL
ncbi:hypothetical protein DFP72DRAFT_796922 [Ephemerocybe angulata]|uniref:Uncharacterized protein n=1 Tax=Ephemerocybe angulata TaxID=980116 RepID=A0A8H6MGN6_9AGAR|nr:hypothetical protein DFP72DRAFT_796922 [Tulosesus angulatus]